MATMTNLGLEQIARLIAGATTNTLWWDYVAIGSGDTTESAATKKLQQEITAFGGRKAATNYYSGTGGYFAKWQCSWGFSAATSVKECGVFNNLADPIYNNNNASTMLFRHKFASAKSMSSGDTLTLTLSVQFTV